MIYICLFYFIAEKRQEKEPDAGTYWNRCPGDICCGIFYFNVSIETFFSVRKKSVWSCKKIDVKGVKVDTVIFPNQTATATKVDDDGKILRLQTKRVN